MTFGSGISNASSADRALDTALGQALAPFDSPPDLGFVFATSHHADAADDLAEAVDRVAGIGVGAVAEGVIGNAIEIEEGPGLAVWLGSLPGAHIRADHLEAVRTPRGITIGGVASLDGVVGSVLVADPFTFPTGGFIAKLADGGIPVVGGFANTGRGPGGAALMLEGAVRANGALLVTFAGEVGFRPVVSQGCRPIGDPAVITASEGITVNEIAGRSAMSYLRELLTGLDAEERAAAARGLQVGVAADEYKMDRGAGDFLIRGITSVDETTGALAVGDHLDVGTTIQFQVRDAGAADEELRRLIAGIADPGGMLLFSCNARGAGLFGTPHHDAAAVAEEISPPALAGMFAAGEIGPVGTANHVHTFTASMLEVRENAG